MMAFAKYDKMKESGIELIGKIPLEWTVKCLKHVSKFELSTVDRHEYDDEIQVSICHYPQVYNNDIITKNTELSKGTCTENELSKFKLKKDDVLITKDSETPEDIGVPAYVDDDYNDTVCGYHLAHLTPKKNQLLGKFLFRYIQSNFVNAYFEMESNGVTRFGLGKYSINNLKIPVPSNTGQKQITSFLDKKIEKINHEISKNEQLIELLHEERQSTINHAVTKGLDDSITLKDSGIEWIGEIPKHWIVSKLLYLTDKIGDGLHSTPDYVEESDYYFINGNNLVNGSIVIFATTQNVNEDEFEKYRLNLNPSTILLSINGTIGNVSLYDDDKIILGKSACYINCKKNLDRNFLKYFLESSNIHDYYNLEKTGTTIFNLSLYSIRKIMIPIPKLSEQKQIISFLDKKMKKIDSLISKVKLQIKQLNKFKESLISSAITGKICISN
jgi:type I restriction enzyme, S subunit